MERAGGENIGQSPSLKQILVASLAGTTVEWYDFFAFATASAIVFNVLFFPSFDPLVGTLLAFSTLAVGFLARPLGGVVFGHFGDRIGRKTMLIIALIVMGTSTVLVGLLPTYAAIGVAAPIILVALRFIQGIALGGELGGAVLMAVEHAPQGRRGLYGSFPQMGVPLGLVLSNLIFLPVTALPDEQFLAWGWRIPFLISVVLVGVGLFVRLKIMETPAFNQVRETDTVARMPIVELLRIHWKEVLLACGAYLTCGVTFYVIVTFSLTYGTEQLNMDRSTMLTLVLVSSVFMLFALPAFGALSDRIGRRPMYLIGAAGMGLAAFPLFWLLGTRVLVLMFLGYLLAVIAFSISYGALGAFFAEIFSTRVRYSGLSLGYQLGTIVGGAFVPIIATELLRVFGGYWPISLYMISMATVSAVCVLLLTETYRSDIGEVTDPGRKAAVERESANLAGE